MWIYPGQSTLGCMIRSWRKKKWFRHVVRGEGTLANTSLHGEVEEEISRERQCLDDVNVMDSAGLERDVGGDRERDVGGDRERDVGGDRERDVGGDRERDVGGDRERDVGGDRERDVGGDRERDVGGDRERDVGGDRERDVGGDRESCVIANSCQSCYPNERNGLCDLILH